MARFWPIIPPDDEGADLGPYHVLHNFAGAVAMTYERLVVWYVYVGASLTDPDVKPLEVFLDYECLQQLWGHDETAWKGLIGHIQDELTLDG